MFVHKSITDCIHVPTERRGGKFTTEVVNRLGSDWVGVEGANLLQKL
jgi:hypothetical protein